MAIPLPTIKILEYLVPRILDEYSYPAILEENTRAPTIIEEHSWPNNLDEYSCPTKSREARFDWTCQLTAYNGDRRIPVAAWSMVHVCAKYCV